MKWIAILLILTLASCSPTKIAKRKYRKAQKLMEQAGRLDPAIADTVWILKTDTLILSKDSLVTKIKLVLDTIKIDSLIDKLAELKTKGADTRAVRHEIFKEIVPDVNYHSIDSLPVTINGQTTFIRFDIAITIQEDELLVITKPISNVPIVTSTAIVSIDARKTGRFWRGVMWGSIGTLLILVALWFLRGVIGTAIKAYIP